LCGGPNPKDEDFNALVKHRWSEGQAVSDERWTRNYASTQESVGRIEEQVSERNSGTCDFTFSTHKALTKNKMHNTTILAIIMDENT
jgi:glucose-6-phosphate dehydrogenase assembly protein OpcA